jgi:hypothetical protein
MGRNFRFIASGEPKIISEMTNRIGRKPKPAQASGPKSKRVEAKTPPGRESHPSGEDESLGERLTFRLRAATAEALYLYQEEKGIEKVSTVIQMAITQLLRREGYSVAQARRK